MEIPPQLQPQQCCSLPYFVFLFPSSAKSVSLLLVQSVNFPEFPVLLLMSCQMPYPVSHVSEHEKVLLFSDFQSLGASSGMQGTKENRRYVIIWCLHVILRPVYVPLLGYPAPAECFCCTRHPLKSVADHIACVE